MWSCVDPVSNFISAGSTIEAQSMLVRMIDILKARTITTLFTDLIGGGEAGADRRGHLVDH